MRENESVYISATQWHRVENPGKTPLEMIEVQTDDADAMMAAEGEFEAATEGKRTTRRRILCQDRSDPSKYRATFG